ncbi:hypothetical protein [Streptomyces sp. NPDC056987]|uniref:DUF7144 family membrane protein n=1 Tax=Streptomyces sp. NPDC056987 TaxID=3345988 RepID=UPI00362E8EEC
MSQNTAQRPPTTGMGTGTGTGTGMGMGTTGVGTGTGAHAERKAAWAVGGSFFAGVLLLVVGVTDILQGIAAVRRNAFLNSAGYTYSFNLTSWGWIHVALGIVLCLVGLAILARARWARYAGIGLASLNLISQFMYLPHQPVWAIVGMALSAFIIWALATDRGTLDAGTGAGSGVRT